eukprot:GHVS01072280.1.p1 GENE.GHVS01072280.1~~GHVS01072280.1.p1  ORF type:complete len:282 (-),score=53.97 GHVS01072280.1:52-897(-)
MRAADWLISSQNRSGGYGTYEPYRSRRWLEFLNIMEVFGDSMIDYPWTECTASCIKGLAAFSSRFPQYRRPSIRSCIERAVRFLLSQQTKEGGWAGGWGVCYTYATWLALDGLKLSGIGSDELYIARHRACRFILSKQEGDGGWGESFLSCVVKAYQPHQNTQVVQTAWAILALLAAATTTSVSSSGCSGNSNGGSSDGSNGNGKWELPPGVDSAVCRGIGFLVSRQLPTGDWRIGSCSGQFNSTVGITYAAYRNVFPLMAVAAYQKYQTNSGTEHKDKLF